MTNEELFALAHKTFEYRDGRLWYRKPRQGRDKTKPAGWLHNLGYAMVRMGGKRYYRARVVWLMHHGYMTDLEIDHINRVRDDDRIENLRELNHFENSQNKGLFSNNKSGHSGVHFNKRDKLWIARVYFGGEARHVGCFKSKEEAVAARNQRAAELRRDLIGVPPE